MFLTVQAKAIAGRSNGGYFTIGIIDKVTSLLRTVIRFAETVMFMTLGIKVFSQGTNCVPVIDSFENKLIYKNKEKVKMKKNVIVRIFVGILLAAILTGGAAMASDGSRNIDIFFRNIKIMIDGAEYVPTDANGNVVEPFIYNGTTYLPVRAVANAFGKDVKWDGENATVFLGKEGRMEPDNRLDKVQYISYTENESRNHMEIVNGTIEDYNNNKYTNGIFFYIQNGNGYSEVTYPLNGQYSRLTGKIVLPKNINTTTHKENNCKTSETAITITDENGEVLYKANGITASMPFSFDINTKGVNQIKVTVKVQGYYSNVALTDLGLYK